MLKKYLLLFASVYQVVQPQGRLPCYGSIAPGNSCENLGESDDCSRYYEQYAGKDATYCEPASFLSTSTAPSPSPVYCQSGNMNCVAYQPTCEGMPAPGGLCVNIKDYRNCSLYYQGTQTAASQCTETVMGRTPCEIGDGCTVIPNAQGVSQQSIFHERQGERLAAAPALRTGMN